MYIVDGGFRPMSRLNTQINFIFIFFSIFLLLDLGCRTASPQDQSDFFKAILADDYIQATKLLEKGVDINALSKDTYTIKVGIRDAAISPGETALHMTATYGKINGVQWLLEKGADVNIKATSDGATPLLRAMLMGIVLYNSLDIANLLIEKGADINAQDNNGWTPLLTAAWGCKTDFARMLLEKGANINAKTNKGWTALYLAVRDCQIDTVKLLLEKGADVTAKDNDGQTPMQIANKQGKTDMIALLQSYGGKE